jgi:hypothetical protein
MLAEDQHSVGAFAAGGAHAGIAVAAYLRHELRPLHEVRTPCSCPVTAAVHPSAVH